MTAAEWDLFCIGLAELVDALEEDYAHGASETETGVEVFDRLTIEQKFALLADVAQAMHGPAVPILELTAASEGTVAAVFRIIDSLLQEEIQQPRVTRIRSRLLAVAAEFESDETDELPRLKSRKYADWSLLLEVFEQSILWDSDWAAEQYFLDLPPAELRPRFELLGIDPDYFLAIPREPNATQLKAARVALERLVLEPTPSDAVAAEGL